MMQLQIDIFRDEGGMKNIENDIKIWMSFAKEPLPCLVLAT